MMVHFIVNDRKISSRKPEWVDMRSGLRAYKNEVPIEKWEKMIHMVHGTTPAPSKPTSSSLPGEAHYPLLTLATLRKTIEDAEGNPYTVVGKYTYEHSGSTVYIHCDETGKVKLRRTPLTFDEIAEFARKRALAKDLFTEEEGWEEL